MTIDGRDIATDHLLRAAWHWYQGEGFCWHDTSGSVLHDYDALNVSSHPWVEYVHMCSQIVLQYFLLSLADYLQNGILLCGLRSVSPYRITSSFL